MAEIRSVERVQTLEAGEVSEESGGFEDPERKRIRSKSDR